METHDYGTSINRELTRIGEAMISGHIGLIEGVRKITALRLKTSIPQDEVFRPFIAFDSETDVYPIGKAREVYSRDYLNRIDIDMEVYLRDAREDIIQACRNLIDEFS